MKNILKFNGKNFVRHHIWYALKSEAEKYANIKRTKGYNVRVIKDGKYYVAYCRKK